MARTLEKTRKQIAKKKRGVVDALHQRSRDSQRLHRARVRDERLEKIADSRRKRNQPLIDRVSYFQEAVSESQAPLTLQQIQEKIHDFVYRESDELKEARDSRRPGRPPSTKEDLLQRSITALEKEYRNGFFLPDLANEESNALLSRWEGSWPYLSTLTWVKITSAGDVKPSSFPPKGDH